MPRGVVAVTTLPGPGDDGAWERIVTPPGTKDRLLGTALLQLLHGRRLAERGAALNGLVLLSGPPGTGKTTLARGLAHVAARSLAEHGRTSLVELDAHALPSELLGESQRNVSHLLRDAIPELAGRAAFTVVLVDEVESLAVARNRVSMEANPIDVHRATDALLEGVDHVARVAPGVLFVTTTNFPSAIDEAFLSRADLVAEMPLPDQAARATIVRRALADLAQVWPAWKALADDESLHADLARRTEGWDGRQVHKLPLRAVSGDASRARSPDRLTAEDLRAAVDVDGAGPG